VKAKTLMQAGVASCRPEDSMAAAAQIMWEHDCGVVPVIDADRRVVGIVTDRDLCMAAYTKALALGQLRVRDAMQAPVFCCHENDTRAAIHAAMRSHQVRRIPVIDDDGRLVGIVSLNDLVLDADAAEGTIRAHRISEIAETLSAISRHRAPVAA
jgi:CBS domain-containing protein